MVDTKSEVENKPMDSLIFQHLQVFSFLYTKAALPDLKSSLVLFKKDKEPLNVAIGSEVSAIFQKVYWQQVNLYLEITSFSNLNYHINFRTCLLICILRMCSIIVQPKGFCVFPQQ